MSCEAPQGQTLLNKEFNYDFMCRGTDGRSFIVEMQCYPEEFWFRRCVSYVSRAYDRQNKKGDGYDVAPVYLIGLMGTDIVHNEPEKWEGRYVSEYTFREKETNELQDETIFIIFAELARFDKLLDDCVNDLERMLYVIKNGWKLQNQPDELRKEIFQRLFDACEIAMFTEEKRIQYDQDMYDERRLNGELYTARKIGREEGLAEGRAEGRAELCRRMLSLGFPKDKVAEAADLSEAELDELLTSAK